MSQSTRNNIRSATRRHKSTNKQHCHPITLKRRVHKHLQGSLETPYVISTTPLHSSQHSFHTLSHRHPAKNSQSTSKKHSTNLQTSIDGVQTPSKHSTKHSKQLHRHFSTTAQSNGTHLDPTTNPFHQYSPNAFFAHVDQYTHQKVFYFDNAYGLTELAKSLGSIAQSPSLQTNILLYGDLGTGKTTFSRFFLRQVLQSPALPVVSPTFTLQVKYNHNKRLANHMDLYRLQHSNEAHILNILETYNDSSEISDSDQLTLGLKGPVGVQQQEQLQQPFDILQQQLPSPSLTLPNTKLPHQAINLIEWPHVLHHSNYMPKSYIRIDLQDKITHKKVTISLHGAKYQQHYRLQDDVSNVSDNSDNTISFGDFIVNKIVQDLGDLSKSAEFVSQLTDSVYFGDDNDADDGSSEGDDDSIGGNGGNAPTFIPRQFTNHRL